MGSKSQACRTISQEITADCAILCPRDRVDGNECLSIQESSQEMMLSEGCLYPAEIKAREPQKSSTTSTLHRESM